MLSSKIQALAVSTVVIAIGASECAGPEGAIHADVEMIVGVRPQRCGGPSFVDPKSKVDARCVAANIENGMPFERWLDSTLSVAGQTYHGEISFESEADRVVWLLTDSRAAEGPYLLQRCTSLGEGLDCGDEVCLEGC